MIHLRLYHVAFAHKREVFVPWKLGLFKNCSIIFDHVVSTMIPYYKWISNRFPLFLLNILCALLHKLQVVHSEIRQPIHFFHRTPVDLA